MSNEALPSLSLERTKELEGIAETLLDEQECRVKASDILALLNEEEDVDAKGQSFNKEDEAHVFAVAGTIMYCHGETPLHTEFGLNLKAAMWVAYVLGRRSAARPSFLIGTSDDVVM